MVFSQNKIEQCKRWMAEAKNAVIIAHKSPDGDAVGSCLALSGLLKQLGLKHQLLLPDAFPDFLKWMKGSDSFILADRSPEKAKEALLNTDLIFTLDFNHPSRVGKLLEEALIQSCAKKVMIDHHINPYTYCDLTFSDNKASSTAEMVYLFIESLGKAHKIDKDQAEAMYTGIVTDTGSFKFPSTSPETHRIAAQLMDAGCQASEVQRRIYDANSISRIKLLGYALNKMEVLPEHKLAYFELTDEELKQFQAKKGDTEGFVNYALSMNGIEIAIFFKETPDLVKISFRSQGNWWINELAAEHFSGGGHKNAAGGASKDSLEKTVQKLLNVLPNLTQYYHD